jgi:hypothetical protein
MQGMSQGKERHKEGRQGKVREDELGRDDQTIGKVGGCVMT